MHSAKTLSTVVAISVMLIGGLVAGCAQTQLGDGSVTTGSTLPPSADTKVAQAPKCAQPLATLAIEDKPIEVLATLGLTSPTPLLRAYISESSCFQIVDPNAAAMVAQHGGKRKAVTPDYVLSADILSENPSAGGMSANVGSLLPGMAGSVLQSVSINTSEVKTALTLVDTRTGLQVAHIHGKAQTTDVGASFGRVTRHGGVSVGAYSDTPIGRTTSAALLDAYGKLVRHVQDMPKAKVASAKR